MEIRGKRWISPINLALTGDNNNNNSCGLPLYYESTLFKFVFISRLYSITS